MKRLENRVALITGGARGQGRAMALKFASEGAHIALLDACRNFPTCDYDLATEERLRATEAEVREFGVGCIAQVGDVRSQEDLDNLADAAFQEFGSIDIACANAGVHSFHSLWEMTEETWNEVVDICLTGVWKTARAVCRQMMAQKSGVIIVTASCMGQETGPDLSHYTAAKHGALGLVKSFAYELGPYNVRANAVMPSTIHDLMGDNPMTREWIFRRPDASTEDYVNATRHWHALRGRAALPAAAVADAAVWLASDEAKHITGVAIPVDAGHLVLPHYNTQPIVDEDIPVGPYENDGITVQGRPVS